MNIFAEYGLSLTNTWKSIYSRDCGVTSDQDREITIIDILTLLYNPPHKDASITFTRQISLRVIGSKIELFDETDHQDIISLISKIWDMVLCHCNNIGFGLVNHILAGHNDPIYVILIEFWVLAIRTDLNDRKAQ